MPERLLEYDNLGTIEQIKIVIDVLAVREARKIRDMRLYCSGRSISFFYSFDGIIELFKALSFVEIVGQDNVLSTPVLPDLQRGSLPDLALSRSIVESLFIWLSDKRLLQAFLPLDHIRFDETLKTVVVRNSQIPLRFSGIRNLLLNLRFFEANKVSPNILMVTPEFDDFFEGKVLEVLKSALISEVSSGGLTLDELKRIQDRKEDLGQQAELFVAAFEKARLYNHPLESYIRIISGIDVSAGYDVISFNSTESQEYDRFIEVKSYAGNLCFYWSRNEVNCARAKGDSYFLYLVDRDRMGEAGYEPVAIRDPYNSVFMSLQWDKEEVAWSVTSKKARPIHG